MKKIFLCAVMAFSVMAASVNTYAYGLKVEDGKIELIEDVDYADEIQEGTASADSGITTFSVELGTNWESDESDFKEYYYDQFNDMQKYVYDYINENIDEILVSSNPTKINLPAKLNAVYSSGSDFFSDFFDAVNIYFSFDHSEKFGYNYKNSNAKYYGYTNYDDNNEAVSVTISQCLLYFGGEDAETIFTGYETSDDIITDREKMESNIDDILALIPQNASRYKKLQIINDWLVDNNEYNSFVYNDDDESASEIAWMLTSALIYGNSEEIEKYPVCEGYAEAFKYLCDKANIPCVSVRSSNHKWNEVQMEDGKWYIVDITWNNPVTSSAAISEMYRYRYFLIGNTSLESKDSSTAHTIKMYDKYNVNTPETSDTDYVYAHNGDVNGDYLIDNEDAAIMLKYISGTRNLTDEEITLGDVDNDGDITLKDVVSALKTMQ